MTQVVIKVIGNYSYQTSRCLGEGVYGKVYEGMQRETKQKVAIKKIDLNTFTNDKYLQNAIFSQIYLLKRFNHPNIVRFKDVLSSKNSLYIITEFCKNGDLKQLIKRKRFKQQQAFDIMKQLLSGFAELVRQKIIHRDLKPANILINEGVYKIGDFGFAKYVDNFGSQLLKSCVGSPIYMAPQILERSQYTTKCDIWSLGIIFYEMIHGYPPWKARDQNQLLKCVKNIPITQVLKKSNISTKCNQFLRRTLAFSQQQRISWNQLFQSFGNGVKIQKSLQDSQPKINLKQKQRITSSNGVSTNLSGHLSTNSHSSSLGSITQPGSTNSHLSLGTNNHSHSPYGHNNSPYGHTNNLLVTPERGKNQYYTSSLNQITVGSTQGIRTDHDHSYGSINSSSKKNSQIDMISQWRQFLVYYHFYCIQMYTNYFHIQAIMNKTDLFGKLLYSLATYIKSRSTYCLSAVSPLSKTNKSTEDLYRQLQNQNQSYQMAYNDISSLLQRNGQIKNIKSEFYLTVGHSEIISEQRMQKIESYMISTATQTAQILSEQVKKRVKVITNRDYSLVQVLDNVLDILRLAFGKNKSIKQIQDQEKQQDQDIKDYVARVFGKVDRLAANF